MFTPQHRVRFLASVVTAVATILTIGGVSHARGVRPATYTGINGPFVYTGMSGTFPMMTTKLKASDESGTPVTVGLSATTVPEFSADGSKAVWLYSGGSTWAIKSANSDGSNEVTVLSGTGTNANNPTFSPNGNFIAFDYGNDIYVISSSSTNKVIGDATRLTTSTAGNRATYPRYVSATKIAYNGVQPGISCAGYNSLYVKDTMVAGNGTQLTNSCDGGASRTYPSQFDVSPDGQWIAYRGLATNGIIALVKTDDTGSRITAYASPGGGSDPQGRPTFSPDGTKIAYSKMTSYVTASWNGSTVGTATAITFPAGVTVPSEVAWAPASAVLSPTTTTTAAPTTTATPTTTTIAATTTVVATTTTTIAKTTSTNSAITAKYEAATPGVTVTDNKVYSEAPAKVADDSSIRVLSIAQNKTLDIESKTPSVCLPNDDELVFLNEGKCIATVVNAKTRAALRTIKTTVVADDISQVQVGNSIVTLAPIYFKQMSSFLDDKALARIDSIKKQVNAAGSILVVGYSGTRNGNSPENKALSRARANATVTALKLAGAEGPFAVSGVGALDPVSRGTSEADQAKNRRVVIVLIP